MLENLFNRFGNIKNIYFACFVVLFIAFIFTFKNIAIMFFASFVIACSINPVVDRLEEKMSRHMAAFLVLSLLSVIILAIFVPVCIISAEEIKLFALSFPKYVDKIDDYLLTVPFFSSMNISSADLEEMASSASSSSADIINNIINMGKNIGTAFVYLVVSAIIIFNMVIDKDKLKQYYLKVFPSNIKKRAEEIGDIIAQKMGGYLIALIATMFGVGLVMFIGLSLFNVKYAFMLSIITGVLDIIPVVGPGVALIICLIMTYQSGSGAILAVIGTFAVAQLIENNFVRPYIFGKFLDLHPIIIFLFLFIAAEFMGVVGVIFAPALAALVAVLFEELYIKSIEN